MIGLKGSPVGFGTDIGGSIRIPAAFNGLYGIRPSSGRLPYEGMANSMVSQPLNKTRPPFRSNLTFSSTTTDP